ncbi:hypothetical protein [Paenibacillus piri]|uniref:Uncharacterized protein n=1 Tax=Paenibacillus piri TaxID=2547395 RepID=A0A4R5KIA8_9BACL|nr:hypothetical protein [Paenibacillus piri]TDF94147.1 hypothetical protein E1757_24980 [Paenibacillus piri]
MNKTRTFVLLGIALITVSTYPLFLIIQENVLDRYVNSRYELKDIIDIRRRHKAPPLSYELASPINWKGNSIEVLTSDTGLDAPKTPFDKEPERIKKITIKVNGKEVSFPTEAWLPQKITGDSNFLSWLNLVEIKDNKNNTEQLAIVQRIGDNWKRGDVISQKWRIIHIDEEKESTVETFSYADRENHILGVKLILHSSQTSSWIGYKSDLAYRLPSIFFPLVYPTGTFLLGILIVIIGFVRYRKQR